MISVNTNVAALSIFNQERHNSIDFKTSIERLTSGSRINRGADDPSGLGIGQGMRAQVNGLSVAIQNTQDGINLLNFLDGAFEVGHDILMRMRDLSMRIANEAVNFVDPNADPVRGVYQSNDVRQYDKEIMSLASLMQKMFQGEDPGGVPAATREKPSVQFNNKPVLMNGDYIRRDPVTGALLPPEHHRNLTNPLGGDIQVGANAATEFQVNIKIEDLHATLDSLRSHFDSTTVAARSQWTEKFWGSYGRAGLNMTDDAIEAFSDIRAQIGVQVRGLKANVEELSNEFINLSAGKSRIMDADMAVEITAFTKVQIKEQSTTAIASQANAAPLITLPLLEAIYNGLAPSQARAAPPE